MLIVPILFSGNVVDCFSCCMEIFYKNIDINMHDNTWASGLYINTGTLTLESGTIIVNGTTSYGVKMTSGVYTQGIYDGSGTDSASVSIINPEINATGTTTGIGVFMGSGTMKFFDGHIYGSTQAFGDGDFVTEVEKNYHAEITDDNKSCILEFNM